MFSLPSILPFSCWEVTQSLSGKPPSPLSACPRLWRGGSGPGSQGTALPPCLGDQKPNETFTGNVRKMLFSTELEMGRCDVGTLGSRLESHRDSLPEKGAQPPGCEDTGQETWWLCSGHRPQSQPHFRSRPIHALFLGQSGRDCLPLRMGNTNQRSGFSPGSLFILPAFSSFRVRTSPVNQTTALPLLQLCVCLPQDAVNRQIPPPDSP